MFLCYLAFWSFCLTAYGLSLLIDITHSFFACKRYERKLHSRALLHCGNKLTSSVLLNQGFLFFYFYKVAVVEHYSSKYTLLFLIVLRKTARTKNHFTFRIKVPHILLYWKTSLISTVTTEFISFITYVETIWVKNIKYPWCRLTFNGSFKDSQPYEMYENLFTT